jgi:hypothetical protein
MAMLKRFFNKTKLIQKGKLQNEKLDDPSKRAMGKTANK